MGFSLLNLLKGSPFEKAHDHAVIVGNCGPIFLRAVESYFSGDRASFELLKEEIRDIEAEADKIKQNIRAHLPPAILMPVDKSLFFSFLREADKVVDCMKNALYWLSYVNLVLPPNILKHYLLLVREDADFLGFLPEMVARANTYFRTRQEKDREAVKDVVKEIRFREQQSDDVEKTILVRICADEAIPPKDFFLMVRLIETTGDIADHLENAADMVRAMVSR